MPFNSEWVEPRIHLEHKDVIVYETYRHGDIQQGALDYHYTVDTLCGEGECGCEKAYGTKCTKKFDVRDLPTWAANQKVTNHLDQIDGAIMDAIDSGIITQEGVKIQEMLGLQKSALHDKSRVVINSMDQHIECLGCGDRAPVPFPMEVVAWVKWCQEWAKDHEEGLCLKESAGGGASPSTGPASSSTPL